jgi:hypothetical protein
MRTRQITPRVLRIAVILMALFNVSSLLVMLHTTPIVFTLFMFVGQPLFVLAFLLLVGAIVYDLKAKDLL